MAGGMWLGQARWSHTEPCPLSLLRRVFLSLFLVSGVPAVLDLRQELPHRFDVFIAPSMHLQIAQLDGLGCGHFLPGDVPAESPGIDTEPLGSLSR